MQEERLMTVRRSARSARSARYVVYLVATAGLAGTVGAQDRVIVPGDAAAIAASSVWAQAGDDAVFSSIRTAPRRFSHRPGVSELTGTVQVRPIGASIAGERLGKRAASRLAKLAFQKVRAEARVAPLVIERADDIGTLLVRVPEGLDENTFAAMLMATGDYEWVDANPRVFLSDTTPNDPSFGSAWQHTRLQSRDAWDITTGSDDVIIAIVDSGIDTNHPDLQGSIVTGYDALTDLPSDQGGVIEDFHGHGTFVAGCAAARGNNGEGAAGVGWNFRVMPIKVTDTGGADLFDLQQGARWAADNGAQIVNVSFTGIANYGWQLTGQYLKKQNTLLFHAAGNANTELPDTTYPDVVVVGSTTSSDDKSGFSNFGGLISLVAPGSGVYSTRVGGSFGTGSGTSYASPIAAGVGALVLAANPLLSADDVQDVIYMGLDDLGDPGEDNIFGLGRVNSYNAVLAAQTFIPRVNTPIEEGFESSEPDPGVWAVSQSVSTGPAPVAPPEGVAAGVFTGAAELTSNLLRPKENALSDLVLRLDALERGAEAGEALVVEYRDAQGAWIQAFDLTSIGVGRTGWAEYQMRLPEAARYSGVEVRVRTTGSDPSDVWYVDDLAIRNSEPLVAPFVEGFDVPVELNPRFESVGSAGISTIASNEPSGSTSLALTTPEPVDTVEFDIGSVDFAVGFPLVRFAWQTAGVPGGESLDVEYRAFGGDWATLGTVTTAGDSTEFAVAEFMLPPQAWAPDFQLRLVAPETDAGETWFIDELYAGALYPGFLDAGPGGCNAADLAEPFDSLTFADISAFLAAFNTQDPVADLAEPFDAFTFADISAFLAAFDAGCP
jgi:subtilisin family serine protease